MGRVDTVPNGRQPRSGGDHILEAYRTWIRIEISCPDTAFE